MSLGSKWNTEISDDDLGVHDLNGARWRNTTLKHAEIFWRDRGINAAPRHAPISVQNPPSDSDQ
jgi:hypothetical protein